MLCNGKRFHRVSNSSLWWRCSDRKCQSTVKVAEDGTVLREPSVHTCCRNSPVESVQIMRPFQENWVPPSQMQSQLASQPESNNFLPLGMMAPPILEKHFLPIENAVQNFPTSNDSAMAAPVSQYCSGFNFGECECVDDEPCFCHPFTAMCAGATKSGKTEWAKRFVLNACHLMRPSPDEIIWCFSEYQPSYEELRRNPQVRLVEGLPDTNYLKSTPYKRKLLVMDDLLMEGDGKKSSVTQLFTKGAHHWNCSCIHIVQNLFYGNIRTARINSHYLILMRNPSDKLQVCQLARQLFPRKQNDFLEAYDDATKEPYGYLVVDLAPNTNEKLRLRSHVFPNEFQCVYMIE